MSDERNELISTWRGLITALADELPEDWQVRGRGFRTSLVRLPDPWTIAWIGFSKSSYSYEGWLHAGVAPLITHEFGWSSPFSIRIDEISGFPQSIELKDENVNTILREFAIGPAAEKISKGASSVLAAGSEKNYARTMRPRRPPHYWLMVPGWRVVFNTDFPIEPATEAIEFYRERDMPKAVEFYQKLVDTWNEKRRDGALEFLKTDRIRKIRASGLNGMKIDK